MAEIPGCKMGYFLLDLRHRFVYLFVARDNAVEIMGIGIQDHAIAI